MVALQLILAVAPAVILLVYIYSVDTADKEPWGLVLKCLGLGAAASVPIVVLELIFDSFFGAALGYGTGLYIVISSVIGVALVEEGLKMAAALVPTWKNREFNYVFDGILYCAAASLGFAMLENIFYVLAGDNPFQTAIVRALLSVPSHCVDGIFMGAFVGMAKLYKYNGDPGKMKSCLAGAILVPVAEHGLFDSLSSSGLGLVVIGLAIAEYIVAYIVVRKFRGANDRRIPVEGPTEAQQAEPMYTAAPMPQVQAKFCVGCGAALEPGQELCRNCGMAVVRTNQPNGR